MKAISDVRELSVTSFTPQHARTLRDSQPDWKDLDDAAFEQMLSSWQAGPAISLWDEGRLLFCCGIMDLWKGLGEAWIMIPDPQVMRTYWREIRYYCKLILEQFISDHGYRRVQARVNVEFLPWAKFLGRLGFERECVMRKFGPNGEDYFMYARVV